MSERSGPEQDLEMIGQSHRRDRAASGKAARVETLRSLMMIS